MIHTTAGRRTREPLQNPHQDSLKTNSATFSLASSSSTFSGSTSSDTGSKGDVSGTKEVERFEGNKENPEVNVISDGAQWVLVKPWLEEGRSRCAAVALGDQIYLLGGASFDSVGKLRGRDEVFRLNYQTSSAIYQCDESVPAEEGMWHTVGTMTRPRSSFAAVAVGDKRQQLVVVGGWCGKAGAEKAKNEKKKYDDSVELYDTVSKKWTELPKMKNNRKGCAAVAPIGSDMIYVFGGVSVSFSLGSGGSNNAEVYNFDTGKWKHLPAMPTNRTNCAASQVMVDGRRAAIVVGGKDPLTGRPLDSAELFDMEANSWTIMPRMTTPRSGCSAASFGDGRFVVVVGGEAVATAEVLDMKSRTWTLLSSRMEIERAHCAAVVLEGGMKGTKLVVVGGASAEGVGLHLTMEEYCLDEYLETHSLTSCPVQDQNPLVEFPLPVLPDIGGLTDEKVAPRDKQRRAEALDKWANEAKTAMSSVGSSLQTSIAAARQNRDEEIEGLMVKIRDMQKDVDQLKRQCEKEENAIRVQVHKWLDETHERVQAARYEAAMLRSSKQNRRKKTGWQIGKKRISGINQSSDGRLVSSPSMNVPDELCCIISGEIMIDPVMAADGHTYERCAIELWLARYDGTEPPRSPVTNEILANSTLTTNYTIRRLCDEFSDVSKTSVSRRNIFRLASSPN